MGIEIPEALQWAAKYVVGAGDWPEGDETAMRRMADAYTTAATTLDDLGDDAQRQVNQLLAALDGQTADAIEAFWKKLGNDEGALSALTGLLTDQADLVDDGANDIEHTKLMIIAQLVIFAVEMAAALAAMATGVGAPAGAAAGAAARVATQAAIRLTMRQLLQRILTRVVKEAALGALEEGGLDLGIRLIQAAKGDRELSRDDFTAVWQSAAGGAIGGAISGGLGREGGLTNGVGETAGEGLGNAVGNRAKQFATDYATEVASDIGSQAAMAAITGEEFELSADTFTSAAAGAAQNQFDRGGNDSGDNGPDEGPDNDPESGNNDREPQNNDNPDRGENNPSGNSDRGENPPNNTSNQPGQTTPANNAGNGGDQGGNNPGLNNQPGQTTPANANDNSGNGNEPPTHTQPDGDPTNSGSNNNPTGTGENPPANTNPNAADEPGQTAPANADNNTSGNGDEPPARTQPDGDPPNTAGNNNPSQTSPTGDSNTPNSTGNPDAGSNHPPSQQPSGTDSSGDQGSGATNPPADQPRSTAPTADEPGNATSGDNPAGTGSPAQPSSLDLPTQDPSAPQSTHPVQDPNSPGLPPQDTSAGPTQPNQSGIPQQAPTEPGTSTQQNQSPSTGAQPTAPTAPSAPSAPASPGDPSQSRPNSTTAPDSPSATQPSQSAPTAPANQPSRPGDQTQDTPAGSLDLPGQDSPTTSPGQPSPLDLPSQDPAPSQEPTPLDLPRQDPAPTREPTPLDLPDQNPTPGRADDPLNLPDQDGQPTPAPRPLDLPPQDAPAERTPSPLDLPDPNSPTDPDAQSTTGAPLTTAAPANTTAAAATATAPTLDGGAQSNSPSATGTPTPPSTPPASPQSPTPTTQPGPNPQAGGTTSTRPTPSANGPARPTTPRRNDPGTQTNSPTSTGSDTPTSTTPPSPQPADTHATPPPNRPGYDPTIHKYVAHFNDGRPIPRDPFFAGEYNPHIGRYQPTEAEFQTERAQLAANPPAPDAPEHNPPTSDHTRPDPTATNSAEPTRTEIGTSSGPAPSLNDGIPATGAPTNTTPASADLHDFTNLEAHRARTQLPSWWPNPARGQASSSPDPAQSPSPFTPNQQRPTPTFPDARAPESTPPPSHTRNESPSAPTQDRRTWSTPTRPETTATNTTDQRGIPADPHNGLPPHNQPRHDQSRPFIRESTAPAIDSNPGSTPPRRISQNPTTTPQSTTPHDPARAPEQPREDRTPDPGRTPNPNHNSPGQHPHSRHPQHDTPRNQPPRQTPAEQARAAREFFRNQPPVDGRTTAVAATGTRYTGGRPSYDVRRHRLASGEHVSVVTIRVHLIPGTGVTPDDMRRLMARTEQGVDRSLNTAPQLLSHDRLLIDVVFTNDPSDAHLRVDTSHRDQGNRRAWSLRDTEQALTDNIRQHMGLMPTATDADPTLSPDELRQISNDIASANTGPRFTNPADTRIEGPLRLDYIESPQFQADVEDSLRDGNQFTTGADPRTHPYGRLINDGGPDFRGRSNNCLDCAVSALSSFYGSPQVSAPRFPDRLPNGSIDEQGGERHGPQRAARWLGGEWRTYENTNQSIPQQYASLHAYIASLGPGSSALVNSYWPALDDDGNWEFDEHGRPVIDGGHSTVIVFPPGASGPVWWDPQHGTTSDAPPASLYQNACSLIFVPIDANGGPHAGNVGNAGASSGVPGEGAPNGPQVPSTADSVRLGGTGSPDTGGESERPGAGPGELRGQPADRGDHSAFQSGAPDDRGDVRRSDSDRPTSAGLPGVPSDMEGPHRANEGDPRGDRVSNTGRITDDASGGTPGPTAAHDQQTDSQLSHGHPGNSRDVPRSDGMGGSPQPAERDLATDGDIRVLEDASSPATDAQSSQPTPPTEHNNTSGPKPAESPTSSASAEPARPGISHATPAQSTTPATDAPPSRDRAEGRLPDAPGRIERGTHPHQQTPPPQPHTRPLDNSPHRTPADPARAARQHCRNQPPIDGRVTTVPSAHTGRPAYEIRRHRLPSGEHVSLLTVRVHLDQGHDVSAADLQRLITNTESAVDHSFNTAPQLLGGDRLLVDVEFTSNPADAHIQANACRGFGDTNNWSVDDGPAHLTDSIRSHLGLPPSGADSGFTPNELRQISNEIAEANTGTRFVNPSVTRIEGPERLSPIEYPSYQHDVEDALRDGNEFTIGADPRTHPFGRLINDGGPEVPGRGNNCLDCSLSALSSFYGSPLVSAPRYPDELDDGSIDEDSGELDGPERAEAWLGSPWIQFDNSMSIPEQAAALHDYVRQLGPGASALVGNYWPPPRDDNGNIMCDERGNPLDGGGHASVIVYPLGADGPVWWDPQDGTTSDTPPPWLTASCELESIPIGPGGPSSAGTPGNTGTSTAVSGTGATHNSPIQSSPDSIRLGVPPSADTGGTGEGQGPRAGELRGQPADRGSNSAPESQPPDDRGAVRRGDPDWSPSAGTPGVPADMASPHRPDSGDSRRNPVPDPSRVADAAADRASVRTSTHDQQTQLSPPHGQSGNPSRLHTGDGLGASSESPERDLAPDRERRVLAGSRNIDDNTEPPIRPGSDESNDSGSAQPPINTQQHVPPLDADRYLAEPHVAQALDHADSMGTTATVDGVEMPVSEAVRRLLPQHPGLARLMQEADYLENSLLARPRTLVSLMNHPEAIPVLEGAVDEVRDRGPAEIIAESQSATGPEPTPLTPDQSAISDGLLAATEAFEDDDLRQPGFDRDQMNNPAYLSAYLDSQYEEWRSTQDALNDVVRQVAQETSGDPGWRNEPKDRVRAEDKIAGYGNDASRLTDLVGAKIVFDTVADIYRAAELLANDSRIQIVDFDDRFAEPVGSGYRDLQMKVRMPNGHIAELRLHLSHIDDVASYEHALYEARRDLKSLARSESRDFTPGEAALIASLERRSVEMFQTALERGL
ncbi:toxin glutamine deamidase domain-containing protein [Nocardia cyriacigeorgica]|uniref:toxin glutamine deamidase domain-containing protein n=1 Tax=Nocardia cyriacigeorgica TaxID=135487 RepID=UPI0024579C2B|nr:toxin glutamine deamidase domain-containing protein [Nocardia cyriacigeorgica]